MFRPSQGALILIAWLTIALNPLFTNRWICDKTWHRLLIARYPSIEYIGNVTIGSLTQSIKRNHVGPFDVTANAHGVYYASFKHECPYNGTKRMVHYFYQDTKRICPDQPSKPCDVTDMYAKSAQMVERRLSVCRNKANAAQEEEVEKHIRDMIYQRIEEENKRKIEQKKSNAQASADVDTSKASSNDQQRLNAGNSATPPSVKNA